MHYDCAEDEERNYTLKVTLPKKWETMETSKLVEFFLKNYNGKFPEHPLVVEQCHVEDSKGLAIPNDCVIIDTFQPNEDLSVCGGAAPLKKASPPAAVVSPPVAASAPSATEDASGRLRCKHYGCNQLYREEENAEGSCHYHVKPPFFHDTAKGWSCCPNKSVYDWDDFSRLAGCTVGRHSQEDPKQTFAVSPTVAAAERAAAAAMAQGDSPVKSISEFNQKNPEAPSALASALAAGPRPVAREGGKGRCLHAGCQKWYALSENCATSCRYHSGKAVFHDTAKYWSCCEARKAYDFDDFMKIEGCCVGAHDDGNAE